MAGEQWLSQAMKDKRNGIRHVNAHSHDYSNHLLAKKHSLSLESNGNKTAVFLSSANPMFDSDEILHAALLRHDRIADQLITQEIRRLYRAIVETIHNAVKHRGVGLDGSCDVFGQPGGYDEYLEVYGRGGERSKNGRGDVLTAKVGGTTHYYCDYQV